jgi:hypothetical protein
LQVGAQDIPIPVTFAQLGLLSCIAVSQLASDVADPVFT